MYAKHRVPNCIVLKMGSFHFCLVSVPFTTPSLHAKIFHIKHFTLVIQGTLVLFKNWTIGNFPLELGTKGKNEGNLLY